VFDGVVGMGYDSLSITKTQTPFSKLMQSSTCVEKIVAFWLNQLDGYPGGEMTLCGTDPSLYVGSLFWVPVYNRGSWEFNMETVSVDSTFISRNSRAIVDTGTSLIIIPYSDASRINALLGARSFGVGGLWYWPDQSACNILNTPDVVLRMNGRDFTLTARDYTLRMSYNGDLVCVSGFSGTTATDRYILGYVFLRKYYSAYNFDLNAVGFALSRSAPTDPPTRPTMRPTETPVETDTVKGTPSNELPTKKAGHLTSKSFLVAAVLVTISLVKRFDC